MTGIENMGIFELRKLASEKLKAERSASGIRNWLEDAYGEEAKNV